MARYRDAAKQGLEAHERGHRVNRIDLIEKLRRISVGDDFVAKIPSPLLVRSGTAQACDDIRVGLIKNVSVRLCLM